MIKLYKKKPIPVEVVEYTGTEENIAFISMWSKDAVSITADGLEIKTLEGVMRPSLGDYVIKGSSGEYWFIRKAIFEHTYEEV